MEIHSDDNSEQDEILFNLKRVKTTDISEYEQCTTGAKDMRKFGLYEDNFGRLYRPRRVLTEKANGDKKTQKDVSERYICFDVYLLPAPRENKNLIVESETVKRNTKRQKREKPKREEKASPVEEGEELEFFLYRDRATDTVSVKSFIGVVDEVHWGSLVVKNKRGGVDVKNEPNFGFIRVSVKGVYPRSLIILPEYELAANLHDLPA